MVAKQQKLLDGELGFGKPRKPRPAYVRIDKCEREWAWWVEHNSEEASGFSRTKRRATAMVMAALREMGAEAHGEERGK